MTLSNFNIISETSGSNLKCNLDFQYYTDNDKMTFYRKIEKPKSKLMFAGNGDVGRDSCGQLAGFFTCPNHHSVHGKINYCYKISCPICFHKAIHRQSMVIRDQLRRIRLAYRKRGYSPKICHYSFNVHGRKNGIEFGWDAKNDDEFDKARLKLQRILKKYDFGGAIFFHEFRKYYDKKTGKANLYYSPHFHVLGFGWLPNYEEFLKKHGFTYTNLTRKKTKDHPNPPDHLSYKKIYLKARYILSHCSFKNKKNAYAYHWFGTCSTRNFYKINEIKRTETVLCEICEMPFFLIEEVKFTSKLSDDPTSFIREYQLEEPIHLNNNVYMVEKIHIWDLAFKNGKGPPDKTFDMSLL